MGFLFFVRLSACKWRKAILIKANIPPTSSSKSIWFKIIQNYWNIFFFGQQLKVSVESYEFSVDLSSFKSWSDPLGFSGMKWTLRFNTNRRIEMNAITV